jgi:hypothetical protein
VLPDASGLKTSVQRKDGYLTFSITMNGWREVPGTCFPPNEAPSSRCILIYRVDRLDGFPDALEASLPETVAHTCVVHFSRGSLDGRCSRPQSQEGEHHPPCRRPVERRLISARGGAFALLMVGTGLVGLAAFARC